MTRDHQALSRRERQILDVLYRRGRATAAEVRQDMQDAPGYSGVRALLRILEEKGQVVHEQDGPRYVFSPKVSPERAKRSAVRHLVETFFDNSASQAVAALLGSNDAQLSPAELDRLSALIDRARTESEGDNR